MLLIGTFLILSNLNESFVVFCYIKRILNMCKILGCTSTVTSIKYLYRFVGLKTALYVHTSHTNTE